MCLVEHYYQFANLPVLLLAADQQSTPIAVSLLQLMFTGTFNYFAISYLEVYNITMTVTY